MQKTRYKRWQVILGFVGFLAVMGVVGSIDQSSQQAMIDEKTSIRDQIQAHYDNDVRLTVQHFEQQARGPK